MDLPKRIIKETERILQDPVPGIEAHPHEDNLRYFEVTIMGPADSPYQDGKFNLELYLPEDYPMGPPKVRFLTRIYHPNIDKLGRICLDILKGILVGSNGILGHSSPSLFPISALDKWSPALQIRTVLLSIQALMGAPNPDDPLANDVASHWKSDEKGAIEKGMLTRLSLLYQVTSSVAREWTRAYAQANPADQNRGATI